MSEIFVVRPELSKRTHRHTICWPRNSLAMVTVFFLKFPNEVSRFFEKLPEISVVVHSSTGGFRLTRGSLLVSGSGRVMRLHHLN